MREILFRGKRLDNGEWVVGSLWIFLGKPKILSAANVVGYDVDPSTVGQYTGLTAKGKRIFEGDILKCHDNDSDLVVVKFGEFIVYEIDTCAAIDVVNGWHIEPIETDALSKALPFCLPLPLIPFYLDRCEAEIIGNKWDNPELVEGEDGK